MPVIATVFEGALQLTDVSEKEGFVADTGTSKTLRPQGSSEIERSARRQNPLTTSRNKTLAASVEIGAAILKEALSVRHERGHPNQVGEQPYGQDTPKQYVLSAV